MIELAVLNRSSAINDAAVRVGKAADVIPNASHDDGAGALLPACLKITKQSIIVLLNLSSPVDLSPLTNEKCPGNHKTFTKKLYCSHCGDSTSLQTARNRRSTKGSIQLGGS
jgi:hypothetical protein